QAVIVPLVVVSVLVSPIIAESIHKWFTPQCEALLCWSQKTGAKAEIVTKTRSGREVGRHSLLYCADHEAGGCMHTFQMWIVIGAWLIPVAALLGISAKIDNRRWNRKLGIDT